MNRRFRMFYDSECPICRREAAWLKRRDRFGSLELEDIAALGFDPGRYGLTRELPLAKRVRPESRTILAYLY
ncbi:MAG: DCC1-like thiol-disulfide oxidoreductase family protein [Planctomycetota bacterium]|jgi:hypothetical protein